jgi:hypothetical protein
MAAASLEKGACMAEAHVTRRDLEMLSAGAHTAESFGRAIIASSLAAAAQRAATFASGRTIRMQLNVSVTPIKGVGAWVCVGVPGFGTFCRLERQD